MKKLTVEERAKLPKWAQAHISALENKVEDLQREKAAWFRTPPSEAKVVLTNFHGHVGEDNADQPLDNLQKVRFYLAEGSHHRWQNYIEVGIDFRNEQQIMIHGCDTVEIVPQASNTFAVKLGDR